MPRLLSPAGPLRRRAGCKINLGLSITGIRADGYHLLDSLFYPLEEPCDLLTVSAREEPGCTVITDEPGIDPERNTLTRACRIFAAETGLLPAVSVRLEKGIPWGAGLGGGSSDAACLLRVLAELAAQAGSPVPEEVLHAVAARTGADVPFFLQQGPMRVRGIGDILTPARAELPGRELLLVLPPLRVSTPWAFRAYDEAKAASGAPEESGSARSGSPGSGLSAQKSLTGMDKAGKGCFPLSTPAWFANDLEPVVFRRYPELKALKEQLLRLGACVAAMSGSGSSVYGLFEDRSTASAAAAVLAWPVRRTTIAGM